MSAHRSYYHDIAESYKAGDFATAAKLFSAYPEGNDPLPSLAILSDAIVQPDGNAQNGSYFIITKGCSSLSGSPTKSKPSHVYDKVATISHYWGEGYYHFFGENLVRLPMAIEYLSSIREKSYMVHVKTKNQFTQSALALLGISSSRLVDGLVGAKTLYIPEPTPCGTPSAPALRLMRMSLLRAALGGQDPEQAERRESNNKCVVMVVQRRKASRSISNHEELVKALREGLEGCEVRVHDGKGEVREQLMQFRQAKIVVGPHGAGLSNMIACRVGTVVVEFLPAEKHVNVCYMAMALKLMLRYIGITPEGATQWGPMTVNVSLAMEMLRKHWKTVPGMLQGRGGGR
ncbi:hypothetical protein GUITHDRAFT_72693 [Guillardia theta CCMP2712]|uniref:Glycosyltransferase 61 catalytic domain-containing protein n=2 Tax=Guillardia theta TaxID=55529 RepID=L1J6J7_GUITC|nr:hypothetical protein GUITHDRAFT_72693 [Guillardia theta CCMP2712]EKX43942.1 hypothetical protein GUITHDRAFT_72693 [Guillardia theta CCMP2712]|eukprot:XP_005830922.1 hypothetical protein GUITHDRAFT_72693 [Guillardia theta CCMP2712]